MASSSIAVTLAKEAIERKRLRQLEEQARGTRKRPQLRLVDDRTED